MQHLGTRHTFAQSSRRWVFTVVIATVLALTTAYTPIVLDGLAGTDLTPAAFACGHPTGEC